MSYYRPLAYFVSATVDIDGVEEAIATLNDGCIHLNEEVFRTTSLRDAGALLAEDCHDFAQWLVRSVAAGPVNLIQINRFLKALVHRRWARFHVYCEKIPILRMSKVCPRTHNSSLMCFRLRERGIGHLCYPERTG